MSPAPSRPVPLERFLAVLAAGIRRQDAVTTSVAPAPVGEPVVPATVGPELQPVLPAAPSPDVHAALPAAPPAGAPVPATSNVRNGAEPVAVPTPSGQVPAPAVPSAMSAPAASPPAVPVAGARQPAMPLPAIAPQSPPPPVQAAANAVPPPPVAPASVATTPASPAAPPMAAFVPSLPAMSLPVLETAVFMHARGLPATPATAAAAHEFLFAVPRLPAALDRFEVAAAVAKAAPQPEPLQAAVERLTGIVRAVRVSPEAPQFARQLQAAVERIGLAHESGLAAAAAEAGNPTPQSAMRNGVSREGAPVPLRNPAGAEAEPPAISPAVPRTQPGAAPDTPRPAPTPVREDTATPATPARSGVRMTGEVPPAMARAPIALDTPARPVPAGRPAAPEPAGLPVTANASAMHRPVSADRPEGLPLLPRDGAVPPPPAPVSDARDPGLAPLRETLKAAALDVRREATEALRHVQTPAHRQPLIALRDAAHEIVQSISSQQMGSWTAADARSVVQVQIPLALGAEIRGGDIRVSWREEKNTRKRDPKVPAQMTMEIETRSLGPVGVHLEMLGNALSLIFRVYDEGVQAFVRDELPDLVNKLTGYDYRITRADCELDDPAPAAVAPLPARPAPTTSLDLKA